MKPELARHCPGCRQHASVEIHPHQDLMCPRCQTKWGRVDEMGDVLSRCPVCGCRQFYRHKDFNQFVGCTIMLVGIVLVPWTYGLSLPAFWMIDLLLHRRMRGQEVAACYRCGSEFRAIPIPDTIKTFMHHIGLKYDKYR